MEKGRLVWPGGTIDFSNGPVLMGIVNVTADSFSDGGDFLDVDAAVAHGVAMAKTGAAIIDVGPESSRPGAVPVPVEQQIKRAIPVISRLAVQVSVPISIDTFCPEVAEASLDAGASIINDITALADARMRTLASRRAVPVVLMHMKGSPATMQDNPVYDDVVSEVLDFLVEQAEQAQRAGILRERIIIDPGLGFGKTAEHNLLLIRHVERFVSTGYRVLIGPSRKRFIGTLTGKDRPKDRLFGTAAVVALCAASGVSIIRVHDVPQMADVVRMAWSVGTVPAARIGPDNP